MYRIPAVILLVLGACSGLERHEFREAHMGTAFRVVVWAPSGAVAQRGARAAFARVAELEHRLSDWDPNSELSRLGRVAFREPTPVSDDLFDVLAAAQRLSAATGGAFDVTVGPIVRLWRRARRQLELPRPERLEDALARVGHDKLRLEPEGRRVELLARDMQLDLGGIAKGYAAEAAFAVLEAHGLPRALVDAGGDVYAGDPPPGRRGWRVGIAAAERVEGGSTAWVSVARCAVATSGDAFRHVDIDGVRYSHVVDPRTGLGVVGGAVATAVARDGATADALASAGCVLGRAAVELVERLPGAELRVTDRAGTRCTSGFPTVRHGPPQAPDATAGRARPRTLPATAEAVENPPGRQ